MSVRQKSPAWCLRTREWARTIDNNSDKVVGAAAWPHITSSKQRRNTISQTFSTTTRRRFSDVKGETVLFTSNSFVVRSCHSKSSMTDDNKARRSDVPRHRSLGVGQHRKNPSSCWRGVAIVRKTTEDKYYRQWSKQAQLIQQVHNDEMGAGWSNQNLRRLLAFFSPWKHSGAEARDLYWVNVEMSRRLFFGPGRADRRRPSPIESHTPVHVFEPTVSGSARNTQCDFAKSLSMFFLFLLGPCSGRHLLFFILHNTGNPGGFLSSSTSFDFNSCRFLPL